MQKGMPPNSKMVFKGRIFEVWQWEQKMFDGSVETFERLRRPDTTQVVTIVGDRILLQHQEQPESPPFLSFPGGRLEEGEDPLESAKRELLEESGYVSEDWQLWKEDHPSNKTEWTLHTYVARNCRKVQEPHLDAGEKITDQLISFDEFLLLADDPTFRDLSMTEEMLRARLDPARKEAMRKLFFGT